MNPAGGGKQPPRDPFSAFDTLQGGAQQQPQPQRPQQDLSGFAPTGTATVPAANPFAGFTPTTSQGAAAFAP